MYTRSFSFNFIPSPKNNNKKTTKQQQKKQQQQTNKKKKEEEGRCPSPGALVHTI